MTLIFDPIKALDHTVTLGVAFAGATAAFLLERYRLSRDERQRRIASLNSALYTTYNIWNIHEQLRRDVTEGWKTKPDAWLNMPATPPVRYGRTTFDAQALDFVLQVDAPLYSEIMLEEQRATLLFHLVEERSRLLLEQAWPRMAAAGPGVRGSTPIPLSAMVSILGRDIVQRLEVYSRSILAHVPDNLASLRTLHDRLRTKAKLLYPKQKFVNVEFGSEKPPPLAA